MSTTYYVRTFISDFHATHEEEFSNLISYPPRHYKNVGIDPTAINLQGGSPGALLSTDNQTIYHFADINSLVTQNYFSYPLNYSATTAPLTLSLSLAPTYGAQLCYDSGTNASSGFDITQWNNRGWGNTEAALKTHLCNYFETNKYLIENYYDQGKLNLYFFQWKHSDTGYYYFPLVYLGNDPYAQETIII